MHRHLDRPPDRTLARTPDHLLGRQPLPESSAAPAAPADSGALPPGRRRHRLGILAGLTVGAWLVAGAVAGTPVHAANTLVASAPTPGAQLAESPTSISLTFAEAVGQTNTVEVKCNGTATGTGVPALSADALTLTIAVPTPLPKGNCVVAWLVTAPDGTTNGSGSFSFDMTADTVVSTPDTSAGTGDPTATTVAGGASGSASQDTGSDDEGGSSGGPLGLGRLIGTIGLAMLFGALVLIAVAWPEGVEYILTVKFLRSAWVAALAGVYLSTAGLAAQVDGVGLGSRLSPTTWTNLTESTPGIAALARFILTLASVWVIIRPERVIDPATQLVALAAPGIAVATLGFSRGGDLAVVGYAAGIVHALAMAVWFGGLVLLARVVLAGPGDEDLVHAVRGFARISVPALLLTVGTGIVQMFRLDRGAIFDTGHGRVLVLKALAVAAMVFVGLTLRQFVRQRVRRVDAMSAGLAGRLRRAVSIEALAGVVVLALTAWMMSLQPAQIADAGGPGPALPARVSFTDDQIDIDVAISQQVGPNAVRVSVNRPVTGLGDLTIVFTPPEAANVSSVILSVPLHGRGAALLPLDQGVPLMAPGTWTIEVQVSGQSFGKRNVQISDT